jgi:CheY-like chemotaxis protein/CBS domain-containing protein
MPDTDAPSRSDSNSAPSGAPLERINLPVPVPQPAPTRESGESWLVRVLRAVFGWKESSARADLQTVLKDGTHEESGFSPQERTMLTNILALRGRRVDDVMVPRADIIAVQQDISLGELIRVFEGAGHSRLVVYNETLDDPVGMVHIRDVIGYMVRHAAVSAAATVKRTILLVDADPAVQRTIKALFARDGHDVEVAGDPRHALELALRGGFDLVITDARAMAPNKRGVLLAEELVSRLPALRDRIIVATGDVRPTTEETLARLGVRYVRKPFNLRDLRVEAVRLWEATALS